MNRFVSRLRVSVPCAALGVLAAGCSRPAPEVLSTAPSTTPPASAPIPSVTAESVDSGPPVPPPFEGEIVVQVSDPTKSGDPSGAQSITYDVKGSKVAYVTRGTSLRAIADLDLQRVYAIDDSVKTYDLMYFKPTGKDPKERPRAAPQVEKKGTMEKVAGLDCEDWAIDDGHEKVDVCAAPGIPYFDFVADAKSGHPEVAWATALTAERAFPLRVVVHDEFGKGLYRADASKATRMKILDAMFLMPHGYQAGDLASETTPRLAAVKQDGEPPRRRRERGSSPLRLTRLPPSPWPRAIPPGASVSSCTTGHGTSTSSSCRQRRPNLLVIPRPPSPRLRRLDRGSSSTARRPRGVRTSGSTGTCARSRTAGSSSSCGSSSRTSWRRDRGRHVREDA